VAVGERGRIEVARKCVVKVILSREQKTMLYELARRLGLSESEMMRTTLMDYAKDTQFVADTVYGRIRVKEV
jgi:hypothetical protein